MQTNQKENFTVLTEKEWLNLFDNHNDDWLFELYNHGYKVIKINETKIKIPIPLNTVK